MFMKCVKYMLLKSLVMTYQTSNKKLKLSNKKKRKEKAFEKEKEIYIFMEVLIQEGYYIITLGVM